MLVILRLLSLVLSTSNSVVVIIEKRYAAHIYISCIYCISRRRYCTCIAIDAMESSGKWYLWIIRVLWDKISYIHEQRRLSSYLLRKLYDGSEPVVHLWKEFGSLQYSRSSRSWCGPNGKGLVIYGVTYPKIYPNMGGVVIKNKKTKVSLKRNYQQWIT